MVTIGLVAHLPVTQGSRVRVPSRPFELQTHIYRASLVKGLRHRLFTAVTRIRIPYDVYDNACIPAQGSHEHYSKRVSRVVKTRKGSIAKRSTAADCKSVPSGSMVRIHLLPSDQYPDDVVKLRRSNPAQVHNNVAGEPRRKF